METPESGTQKIEQIKKDIQQLPTSNTCTILDCDDDHDQHQLLVNLLSQLESLKELELSNQARLAVETKEPPSGIASETETKIKDEPETSNSNTGVEAEVVVKQLKKLEKQNRITHWLLSALIVLTVAWQVSEVSLLLKLKEGFAHPFRSVGNMVAGLIKRPRPKDEEAEKSLLAKVNGSMDLSGLTNTEEQ